MKTLPFLNRAFLAAFLVGASIFYHGEAFAHCDTLDGPVIKAAKQALNTGDAAPVLAWVRQADEKYMKDAFEKTLAVRKLNPEARELADMYFFETLVRIHRAGEGAPYDGLKPAGQVEPAVAAADKAIESGSADQLVRELNGVVSKGTHERFNSLVEKKKHAGENVGAGREFVASYVEFVHYVERLHNNAAAGAHDHGSKAVTDDHGGEHEHR